MEATEPMLTRRGHATDSHTCSDVRHVPKELRAADVIRPKGISHFYEKFTEAYGIPVVGMYSKTRYMYMYSKYESV